MNPHKEIQRVGIKKPQLPPELILTIYLGNGQRQKFYHTFMKKYEFEEHAQVHIETERVSSWEMFNFKAILGNAW